MLVTNQPLLFPSPLQDGKTALHVACDPENADDDGMTPSVADNMRYLLETLKLRPDAADRVRHLRSPSAARCAASRAALLAHARLGRQGSGGRALCVELLGISWADLTRSVSGAVVHPPLCTTPQDGRVPLHHASRKEIVRELLRHEQDRVDRGESWGDEMFVSVMACDKVRWRPGCRCDV